MATITSNQSGDWSATNTWVDGTVPVNGDSVVIAEGHTVRFNVDMSGFANGLAGLIINGILNFHSGIVTYLKMNGNVTGTGNLIVGEFKTGSYFNLSGNLWVATTAYRVKGIINNSDNFFLKEVNSLAEVESTPNSFFYGETGYGLGVGIHNSDGSNPSSTTKRIAEIQRPAVGSENRCTLMFNATGTIIVPTIRMYGWYPEREYTQLDADATLNATTIVLKEDLGLQAGDKIAIGSGTEYGMPAETGRGVYTVQSYDTQTKIVTLTSALLKERLSGDYISIASRPIKIYRTSGTNGFITAYLNGLTFVGVCAGTYLIYKDIAPFSSAHYIDHCTSLDKAIVYNVSDSEIKNSTRVGGASSALTVGRNLLVDSCICISGQFINGGSYDCKIINCISQNTSSLPYGIIKNSKILNVGLTEIPSEMINTVISGLPYTSDYVGGSYAKGKWKNCVFKDNDLGYFSLYNHILFNCIFEGEKEIVHPNLSRYWFIPLESFDHNQIPGNYKAWMRGGRIITENNKLKFICESADYPVFRDYIIQAPANRTIKFLIGLTKDTAGIVSKLQIIDPSNDPLIDSTATPLAESTAQDTTDNQQIGVAYKSTTPKQLILRILCQNSEGNVIIDTTRIDQSLAKKITSLN
jgi:hypothetical protein